MFTYIQFSKCLLCDGHLNDAVSWEELFNRKFSAAICQSCFDKFVPIFDWIDDVYCLYEYNEAMKEYFKRFKFGGDVLLANVFREEIKQSVKKMINNRSKEKSIVVPIPMHPKQLQFRTFAQVEELLKAANIPYIHMLEKITEETQASKNRAQRLNTKKLFNIKNENNVSTIVLFDDIKTTGTTIRLAEKELNEIGVQKVCKIVLAAVL